MIVRLCLSYEFGTYLVPLCCRESCGLPSKGYTDFVWGTEASTDSPISWPVQKMGHFSQGTSRALPSQVLKYGFRTIKGMTGGVRDEALQYRQSQQMAHRK
jgi:hypothetical protein